MIQKNIHATEEKDWAHDAERVGVVVKWGYCESLEVLFYYVYCGFVIVGWNSLSWSCDTFLEGQSVGWGFSGDYEVHICKK